MPTATVTYKAPEGDSKVVEMLGYTFFDGHAQQCELSDQAYEKLQKNRHFTLGAASKTDPEHHDHHDKKSK